MKRGAVGGVAGRGEDGGPGVLKETGPMPGQHGPGGVGERAGQPRCEEVSLWLSAVHDHRCARVQQHAANTTWCGGVRLGLTGDFLHC